MLLPSADVEESIRIVMERFKALVPDCDPEDLKQVAELNRHFVEHPANAQLAKYTIYTANQSPSETCREIINTLML